MSKGGYRGGSTIVGPQSGWFSHSPPKKRRISRAAAVGAAVTADRAEQRAKWHAEEHPPVLLTREGLNDLFGRSAWRTPNGANVSISDIDATSLREKRLARKAAKRRRLGIEE